MAVGHCGTRPEVSSAQALASFIWLRLSTALTVVGRSRDLA